MTISTYPKSDLAEIKRTISLLHFPGDAMELRAINKKGYVEAGYFKDFDKMAREAYKLSEDPEIVAVYLIPNEGNKDLFSRAANRMYTSNDGKRLTTSDKDIVNINWFLIDGDAKRPAGISSTDEQHEAAIKMTYEIRDYLINVGFNKNSIILGDSANGGHILVRINLKPTDENKALIKSCTAALKAKFENDVIAIDESVINPARIWKIYGTISKKGDFTDERPHRKSRLLEVPGNIEIDTIKPLETLAAEQPKAPAPAPKPVYQSKGNTPTFNLETWIGQHSDRVKVKKQEPYNGGTRYILDECVFDSNHNGTSAAIIQLPNGAIDYKCQHNSCVNNDWRKLRELVDPEYVERKQRYEQREYTPPEPGIFPDKHYHKNDVGNAHRLMALYGDKIRYSYDRKAWYIYTGKYWKLDGGAGIMALAQKAARSIYKEAAQQTSKEDATDMGKWACASESNAKLQSMIDQTKPLASIEIDELDQDIWLLNCVNGTINLRTGKLQPHNPADYITRCISTKYNPEATSAEWVKFLNRTFGNKAELIDFCKRALGYSITGSQGEQAIFFCFGEGWNGKSTLLGAIRLILGEYATEVEPAAFMVDKNRGTGPNESLASLYNINFVTSTEVEEGQHLSTSLLKRMTGGESLRCEHKFERGFNYKPRYKLWLSGNHQPQLSDTTKSIKNRLHQIPFLHTITRDDPDFIQHYDEVLFRDHGEAILAWLVQASLEYQDKGLGKSADVSEATQAYFDNQDVLHDFMKELCFVEPKAEVTIADLYKRYQSWCESNGDKNVLGKMKFNNRITEKGFVKKPGTKNVATWHGLRLLTDDEIVNLVKNEPVIVKNETSESYKLNLFNKIPGSSLIRDNEPKLPEKPILEINSEAKSELKVPQKLASDADECPVCGGLNVVFWPDGSVDKKYCTDCFPEWDKEPPF